LYFAGQSVSLIGTWMQRMAVSWLIYNLTHSPLMLGVVSFAGLIPTMLLSPIAGTVADRYNRYRVLLVTQVAAMIQAGLLAAMVLSGQVTVTGIVLLSTMLGIINVFDIPVRQSLVVELIDNKTDLPNAIALNSSMVNLAKLLGPATAGVVIAQFGEGICFLLNFLSFIAVIFSLLLMNIKPRPVRRTEEKGWEGLQRGYAYIKERRDIRSVLLLLAGTSFLMIPYTTLLPVFAKDIFGGGAGTFSVLTSVTGLGALVGAFLLASLKPGRNLTKVIGLAGLLFAGSLLLFSYTTVLPAALFLLTTTGLGMMLLIASSNTFIQMNLEDHMRGRVMSYYVMAFQGVQPLGSLLVGWLAHQLGVAPTVLLQGLIGGLAVAAFAYYQHGRKKDAGSGKVVYS
jgi:MFS family permease